MVNQGVVSRHRTCPQRGLRNEPGRPVLWRKTLWPGRRLKGVRDSTLDNKTRDDAIKGVPTVLSTGTFFLPDQSLLLFDRFAYGVLDFFCCPLNSLLLSSLSLLYCCFSSPLAGCLGSFLSLLRLRGRLFPSFSSLLSLLLHLSRCRCCFLRCLL